MTHSSDDVDDCRLVCNHRLGSCGELSATNTLIGPLGRSVGASDHATIILFVVVVFWGHVVRFNRNTFTF